MLDDEIDLLSREFNFGLYHSGAWGSVVVKALRY